MAYRLDPPHDRVTLSPAERAAFGLLEQQLEEALAEREAVPPTLPRASRRARVLSHFLWLPRLAPGAVVLGLVLMVAALPSSLGLSLVGAVTAVVAAAVILRRQGGRLAAWIRRIDRGR